MKEDEAITKISELFWDDREELKKEYGSSAVVRRLVDVLYNLYEGN